MAVRGRRAGNETAASAYRKIIVVAALLISGAVLFEQVAWTMNDSLTSPADADVPQQHQPQVQEENNAAAGFSPTTPSIVELLPNQCSSPSRGQFDNIYKSGIWGPRMKPPQDFYGDARWPPKLERKKSASGGGSELGEATQTSLSLLKSVITTFNVSAMLDIPCGDVNWIFDSFETDAIPLYVGLDIVQPVIAVNQMRFAHHNNKLFSYWDATECALPRFKNGTKDLPQAFDLVHVRDVIQHMPQKHGVKFFCNVFRSGAKRLLTTSFSDSDNRSIREGGFYKNNLSVEPFSFPPAEFCSPSHPTIEGDDTCLYDLTLPWIQTFISEKC